MVSYTTKGILLFLLGFIFSQFITPLPTLANPSPLDSVPTLPFDKDSPSNWITEDQITVMQNQISIAVQNPKWARLTDTNSMDPVFDTEAHVLQVTPNIADLQEGDIITFTPKNSSQNIIHRITYIGEDEKGWFAYTKGDNLETEDAYTIRAEDVSKVVIGIIY